MPQTLPPNTYDLMVKVRVTLPDDEKPEQQDITLLITDDYRPWPKVMLHDFTLMGYETVPPSIDRAKEKAADEVMRQAGLKS